jgi:hypothetical protein
MGQRPAQPDSNCEDSYLMPESLSSSPTVTELMKVLGRGQLLGSEQEELRADLHRQEISA